MNRTKNQYVEMALPNILFEIEHGKVVPANMTIDKYIEAVIMAVAKARPDWVLIATGGWVRGQDTKEMCEFRVECKDEVLGKIRWGSMGRFEGARISNKRLAQARSSNREMFTSDPAKATKAVLKYFGSKSLREKVDDMVSHTARVVSAQVNTSEYALNYIKNKITTPMFMYIAANMAECKEWMDKAGIPSGVLEEIPEAYADYCTHNSMRMASLDKTGVDVMLDGEKYLVCGRDNAVGVPTDPTYFTTDTLPQHIKGAIGMLKLVEKDVAISDVGIRISDNAFFVIAQPETEGE